MSAQSSSRRFLVRLIPVVLLIFAAGVGLAVLSFKLADREFEASVRQLELLRKGVETDLVLRTESRIAEAERFALNKIRKVMLADLDALNFEPVDPSGQVFVVDSTQKMRRYRKLVAAATAAEDLHYFELAMRGGEDYEFVQKQPLRALDAYSFYMPRIGSKTLRARLRFHIARMAVSSGQLSLAQNLYRDLLKEDPPARAGSLSLADFAGLALLDLESANSQKLSKLSKRLLSRLHEQWAALPPAIAMHLLRQLPQTEPALKKQIEGRQQLEQELLSILPEVLASGLLWRENSLWLAVESDEAGSTYINRQQVLEPTLLESRYQLQVWPPNANSDSAQAIRAPGAGRVLARVTVNDPLQAMQIGQFEKRRNGQQIIVIILLCLVAASGITMWILLDRQRRLAEFKVNLLANVSHELKTPITSMRILSELLAREELPESKVQYFGRLLTAESQRLGQRVEDLLDYAQGGTDSSPLARESIDLCQLLGSISETFAFRAQEAGVQFSTDLAEQILVEGDHNAIERIVLNLLDNGIKYKSESEPTLALRLHRDESSVQVCVRDNGIGISARDQAQVFDEFFRSRFENYAVQGAGLGLAIASTLAQSIGATLKVESELGVGSCFILEFSSRTKAEGSGAGQIALTQGQET